jgi:hypothetical protein
MKKLSNKINNAIITINTIDINNNFIVYNHYETQCFDKDNKVIKEYLIDQTVYYFKNINLKDYLNENTDFTELVLTQLLSEVFTTYTLISNIDEEPVYTTSSDWNYEDNIQNWLFDVKPYRVTLDAIQHNRTVLNNSDYELLTDELFTRHKGFIIYNKMAIIVYVNGLLSNEIDVVKDFINVWIFTENNKNN